MAKPQDASMPLLIDRYVADTMMLTTEQHGAYLLLLMTYWRTGPLPDNDAWLAAAAKMNQRDWVSAGPVLRRFFRLGDDGCLHQKRADIELARAVADHNQKRTAGRASAASRQAVLHFANDQRRPQRLFNGDPNGEQTVVHKSLNNHDVECVDAGIINPKNECESGIINPPREAKRDTRDTESDIVINAWNAMASRVELSTIRTMTPRRRRNLAARLREHGLDGVMEGIERIGASRFCTGDNDRGWKATFDFLLQDHSLTGAREGKYDDRTAGFNPTKLTGAASLLWQLQNMKDDTRPAKPPTLKGLLNDE